MPTALDTKTSDSQSKTLSALETVNLTSALHRAGRTLALLTLAIALLWFGVRALQPVDPYVASVMSLEGDQDRGYAIFQTNCAECHGVNADGKVGPSLVDVGERRSPQSLIEQVVGGKTPPMPQFQASPQDMADLLTYLDSL